MATQVVLLNEQQMFTDSMELVLNAEPDIEVVAAHCRGNAPSYIDLAAADVVILDYDMHDCDVVELARGIRARAPHTNVVMLFSDSTAPAVRNSVAAGCLGVVSKDRGTNELIGAVRSVARGQSVAAIPHLSHMFDEASVETVDDADLTVRQREVLELMAEGLSTDALAAAMFVSRNTVRSHVHQVLLKLEAKSKLEAVAAARRRGILS